MQGDCPTPGCTGIGHVKGAKYTGHHRFNIALYRLILWAELLTRM